MMPQIPPSGITDNGDGTTTWYLRHMDDNRVLGSWTGESLMGEVSVYDADDQFIGIAVDYEAAKDLLRAIDADADR